MKTIRNLVLAAALSAGCLTSVQAQQKTGHYRNHRDRYVVSTQLTEGKGTYSDRKLFRTFLTEDLKECPFISNFHIIELKTSRDNHRVVWIYNISEWNDIARFYNWINTTMHSSEDSTLIKALTPYAPNYSLGGAISVSKRDEEKIAKK